MSDDIVARLRNAPWTTADDCNAAADEIERLRARIDELEDDRIQIGGGALQRFMETPDG